MSRTCFSFSLRLSLCGYLYIFASNDHLGWRDHIYTTELWLAFFRPLTTREMLRRFTGPQIARELEGALGEMAVEVLTL
jgi:hypothetical protein